MTLQKLKEQVLRGSHISKEEAEWLAVNHYSGKRRFPRIGRRREGGGIC